MTSNSKLVKHILKWKLKSRKLVGGKLFMVMRQDLWLYSPYGMRAMKDLRRKRECSDLASLILRNVISATSRKLCLICFFSCASTDNIWISKVLKVVAAKTIYEWWKYRNDVCFSNMVDNTSKGHKNYWCNCVSLLVQARS